MGAAAKREEGIVRRRRFEEALRAELLRVGIDLGIVVDRVRVDEDQDLGRDRPASDRERLQRVTGAAERDRGTDPQDLLLVSASR